MSNDSGFRPEEQAPAPQVNKAQEDGGVADRQEVRAPIENALYATNRFTTDQATELAEGILDYLLDDNYWPVKIPPPDAGKEQEAVQDELWNEVAALTNGVQGHRFYTYPHILAELKSKYHITKQQTK